jgi:hypothetical protein
LSKSWLNLGSSGSFLFCQWKSLWCIWTGSLNT